MPDGCSTLRVWTTARYDHYAHRGEARQEYEILRAPGEVLERRELSLRFAVVDQPTFEAEVAIAGFEIQHLWGDYQKGQFEPEASPFMIWQLGDRQ